jgi:hypothetical protein
MNVKDEKSVRVMQAYRRSRNTDPFIVNFGTRYNTLCKFYPGVAYHIKTDIYAFVSHKPILFV